MEGLGNVGRAELHHHPLHLLLLQRGALLLQRGALC